MKFFVMGIEINPDYIHVIEKEFIVKVMDWTSKEVRSFRILRYGVGFSSPKMTKVIDLIEAATSWQEIESLDMRR